MHGISERDESLKSRGRVNCEVTQHISCYVALINMQSSEVKKCLEPSYGLSVELPLQGKIILWCKRLHNQLINNPPKHALFSLRPVIGNF